MAKKRIRVIAKKMPVATAPAKMCKHSGLDMILIVLSIAMIVTILLKLFPVLMDFVTTTNIWWFVLALVIFAIKPIKNCYKK